jgi:hypothetical protein
LEVTPSEFSMSAASHGAKGTDIESTTMEHNSFTYKGIHGPIPGNVLIPHTNYRQDLSVATTVGSGSDPPSVISETT